MDGYFHIKYSQLLRTQGLIWDFPWLSSTIYSQNFADDHFLFHVIQAPFTFGDLRIGAKAYATIVAAAIFVYFYTILLRNQIRYPLIWTAGLLVSAESFLLRISMARAPGISLLFLLIGTDLILRKCDRSIGILAFLFVWLYGGFPLLPLFVVVAFGVSFIIDRIPRYGLLAACGVGTLLGLIIHPYFPDNVRFLYTSYTQIELGTFSAAIKAGVEDYPYSSASVVRNALLVWAVVFGVICVYLARPAKMTSETLTLFLFSVVLLGLYMNARRFIEYWPPFAFLFAAFALDPFLSRARFSRPWRINSALCAAGVALVLAVAAYDGFTELHADQKASTDHRYYEGAANYLKHHTLENEIVFTSDWDDFPYLFHFNSHNRYVVGLGLHYLYLYDAQLYKPMASYRGDKRSRPGRIYPEALWRSIYLQPERRKRVPGGPGHGGRRAGRL